jgi:hypothetical protein
LLRHVVDDDLFAVRNVGGGRPRPRSTTKLFRRRVAGGDVDLVAGAIGALRVLMLSEMSDRVVGYVSTFAFRWLFLVLLRAFNAILDMRRVASRNSGWRR